MWTIPKPTKTALQTFNTCIEGVTNQNLHSRLVRIRGRIEAAESAFDVAAAATDLHLIQPAAAVGAVRAADMKMLYDRHMARGKSRGRPIYDGLMIAAPFDQCPFCGHRDVSTLDHCLPKAQHPALAVTPINLVPCCKDCNHKKGNFAVVSKEDQLLNPYYDDISNDPWLHAEIVQGSPPGVKFSVIAPQNWGVELAARVHNHFTRLDLARLYASQGGRHLQNMRGALSAIYDAAGPDAVREDLNRRYTGCLGVSINSWEGALCRAARDSDWYCDAGFRA